MTPPRPNTLFKFIITLLTPIMINGGESLSVSNAEFFSESYSQARPKFLAALDSLGAKKIAIEHLAFKVPSRKYANLMIDAAYLPARRSKKRLLIVTSGIHGAEAPIGSALQLYFLREIAPKMNFENTGVLLIHALNPFGFETGRRVTENNVDLNRNFFSNPKEFKEIHNDAYDKYRDLLSQPHSVGTAGWEAFKISLGFIFPVLRGAKKELTKAVAGGQYADEKGIYFGGKDYEPQVAFVDEVLKKFVAGYEEVIHYDIHTGLGASGSLQFITSIETNPDDAWVKSAVGANLARENGMRVVTPDTKGFYQTSGDILDFVYAHVSKQSRAAGFTAEFGTLGDNLLSQLSTSTRIILENRGYHWGYKNLAEEQGVKQRFRALFNPSDHEWRDRAMVLGARAFEIALHDALAQAAAAEPSEPSEQLKKAQ